MSWSFFRSASSKQDMLALIAEDSALPQPIKDLFSGVVNGRAEGPLRINGHGHHGVTGHLGDFFHLGEVRVEGIVFDVPRPVVAPSAPTASITGGQALETAKLAQDAQASAGLAAQADRDGTGSVVEPPAAPVPGLTPVVAAALLATGTASTDPMGGTLVALSEDPKDHA